MKKNKLTIVLVLSVIFLFFGCSQPSVSQNELKIENETLKEESAVYETKIEVENAEKPVQKSFAIDEIPQYNGKPYEVINSNQPYFSANDYKRKSFEIYSELDSLKRCGVAYANIGKDIMPTEKRESIGSIKPSGWQTVKYDIVDGKYLYNRCHLIGFQLSGENANEKNLITGTRYMNVQGMLPFENMVADYVKETNNHVLLRVTPVFEGDNLLATGVLMEAFSVEDEGDGICFNVFCYNVQPGITIDYFNGSSKLTEESNPIVTTPVVPPRETVKDKPALKEEVRVINTYIGNKSTKKFHYPSCRGVKQIKESNKVSMECTRDEIINKGYSSCGICHP